MYLKYKIFLGIKADLSSVYGAVVNNNRGLKVFYYGDEYRFVVWFNDVAHWYTNFENSYYDFQIVLYPNGEIDLNYNTLSGTHDATVGIQNSSGNDGLQIAAGSCRFL